MSIASSLSTNPKRRPSSACVSLGNRLLFYEMPVASPRELEHQSWEATSVEFNKCTKFWPKSHAHGSGVQSMVPISDPGSTSAWWAPTAWQALRLEHSPSLIHFLNSPHFTKEKTVVQEGYMHVLQLTQAGSRASIWTFSLLMDSMLFALCTVLTSQHLD